ncbi:hypothetical protein MVLG_03124 [Microbotryum lychnidis-dioicae p1A1 Lamole]|uniref:glucan 1,3-beta-glucosidase n=1 Tax=Microbotryum lychnidis-dioicae (strain p1A1 Lamole / MvSl-1064) TaxID=683840 RepID=U5H786_USTV1|nr:hypothetical protein MVLG_03124 [Microbotryum lychnidis-dioicae p1A1 Lamole]|eukprot:KDE06629.1 hypothetical protein MVLG_03124 [Microbotryum lychnidis-dioicae p1A1 Lamole]
MSSYPPHRGQGTEDMMAGGGHSMMDGPQPTSADLYAAVPTNHDSNLAYAAYSTPYDSIMMEEMDPALGSPSHVHDDVPTSPPTRSHSVASYSDHHGGSYARYDGPAASTYSLGVDGQSQLGLNPRSGSVLGVYEKYEDHEMGDKASAGRRGTANVAGGRTLVKKGTTGFWATLSSRGRKFLLLAVLVVLLLIAVAVAIPTALVTRNNERKANNALAADGSSSAAPTTLGSAAPSSAAAPLTTSATPTTTAFQGIPTGANGSADWRTAPFGGDGSIVYTESGSPFVYNNSFGGFWVSIPFNDSARAQDDVPPLNEPWDYSTTLINGVNLGGWLVTEPFIVPALYEPFNAASDSRTATNRAIDEWTLSEALGTSLTSVMTNHYETFITEQDFAEIASAGLNWVRIPIAWWLVEAWEGEPFLANVGWTYFLKAIGWARKYGLRLNLDLHAVPGSQNGYNHSGRQGTVNFLNGVMGIANAQRTLDCIRTLTEFISQPQYSNVVPMFSVLNEPLGLLAIDVESLRHFYWETYSMMRQITGYGTGKGPFISFHDGFMNLNSTRDGGWMGWMPGSDRVSLDTHPYLCFSEPNNDGMTYQAAKPCMYWADKMNVTTQQFGLAIAGEWSLAINDCGKWLNNVGNGNRYNGTYYLPNTEAMTPRFAGVGSCDVWNDYTRWNQTIKDGFRLVATGHMDAFRHWFFWTWKTGYSNTLGRIANPMWNYQLGFENGWIPPNPREVVGACQSLVRNNGFTVALGSNPAPTLAPWMTGGSGAGTQQNEAMSRSYTRWPPVSLGTLNTANLPQYTPTAPVVTMPVATPTSYPNGYSAVTNPGNGWHNTGDAKGFMTEIAGCTYPDPWQGVSATVPSRPCTGGARMVKRNIVVERGPAPTPPPRPVG